MSLSLEPKTVWLNKNSERFADEATGCHHYISSNPVNRQPDNISFSVFDHALVEKMTAEGIVVAMGYYHYEEQRTALPGLERELRLQAAKGTVKIANSWKEMAAWMGANPSTLKYSIEKYNSSCDEGYDPIFAKDRRYLIPLRKPPFYAVKANSDYLDTIGGIKINHRMEVINKQDKIIPGLYAAGVVAGGWEGDNYCALLSGSTCGFAVNSGRIAAENAAAYISEKK
jgi:fumarate reductase flavoprotein subunit